MSSNAGLCGWLRDCYILLVCSITVVLDLFFELTDLRIVTFLKWSRNRYLRGTLFISTMKLHYSMIIHGPNVAEAVIPGIIIITANYGCHHQHLAHFDVPCKVAQFFFLYAIYGEICKQYTVQLRLASLCWCCICFAGRNPLMKTWLLMSLGIGISWVFIVP